MVFEYDTEVSTIKSINDVELNEDDERVFYITFQFVSKSAGTRSFEYHYDLSGASSSTYSYTFYNNDSISEEAENYEGYEELYDKAKDEGLSNKAIVLFIPSSFDTVL